MPSKRRAKKWRTGSHSVMVGESMIATSRHVFLLIDHLVNRC
jgi:hypothetical protein